jgi:hypothetical protein
VESVPYALPRELERDPSCADIRRRLGAECAALWPGAPGRVPVLALGAPLASALETAHRLRQVVLGLDEATAVLEREGHGLVALEARDGTAPSQRVSRLLLVADDGAERFYRRVARLTADHAPRLLTCRLAAASRCVGEAVVGRRVPVKAVLVVHKQAVADLLRALA